MKDWHLLKDEEIKSLPEEDLNDYTLWLDKLYEQSKRILLDEKDKLSLLKMSGQVAIKETKENKIIELRNFILNKKQS